MGGWNRRVVWGIGACLACGAVYAAGFDVSEQGARALGMGGAFGAQADDSSAVFWNPGGLAFFEERRFQIGLTFRSLGEDSFRGALPAPGPMQTGRQGHRVEPLAQLYWVEPLRRRWVFGLGIHSPFRIDTDWDEPDDWSGRFIAEKVRLRTLDLNPNLAWKASERIGLAFGLVLRASEIEMHRREPLINPTTLVEQEAARVAARSDDEISAGWSFGLLHRAGRRLSWGLSYRSAMAIDYDGEARLTRIPSGDAVFDAVVAATLPLDRKLPFRTSVDFPGRLNLAAACQATPTVLVEVDVSRTGWSVLDRTDLRFESAPALSRRLLSNWDDSNTYRAGVRWSGQSNSEWRLGLYVDKTPQPDEDVSPVLADADRFGYGVGYGTTVGQVSVDFALVYIDLELRKTRTNRDGFNGSYGNRGWLLATSFAW